MLCVQCGAETRCLACSPYRWPSARDQADDDDIQAIRADPFILLERLIPASVGPPFLLTMSCLDTPPGLIRDLEFTAAVTAIIAFCVGVLLTPLVPAPSERPACRLTEPTPADVWITIGALALIAQLSLWNLTPT